MLGGGALHAEEELLWAARSTDVSGALKTRMFEIFTRASMSGYPSINDREGFFDTGAGMIPPRKRIKGKVGDMSNSSQGGVSFTDVLFRGGWRKVGKKKFFVLLVFFAIFAVVVSFGMQFLLRSVDQGASAAGGVEYVGEGFRVDFPGEPTSKSQVDLTSGVNATLVSWSNKQKLYQVYALPAVGEGATAQTVLDAAIASSGGTVIDSHPATVAGASALAAHLKLGSDETWALIVLADDRALGLTLLQSGDARDDSFFDSLRLG